MQDKDKLSILAQMLYQIKEEGRRRKDKVLQARVTREEFYIAWAFLRSHTVFSVMAAIILLSVVASVIILLVEEW